MPTPKLGMTAVAEIATIVDFILPQIKDTTAFIQIIHPIMIPFMELTEILVLGGKIWTEL